MMMSCPGPQTLRITPMTSTGIGSGVRPSKAVQAVAFMPGTTSANGRISTGPDSGGTSAWATETEGHSVTAARSATRGTNEDTRPLTWEVNCWKRFMTAETVGELDSL